MADRDPRPPAPDAPPEARVICGDAIRVLADLPAGIAQTCVTSPPYWGHRDYGVAPRVWGVEGGCRRHRWEPADPRHAELGLFCRRCRAWKGCLGLEPDPDLYVEHIVGMMREVRRTLRPEGTLWLNLGDTYAKTPGTDGSKPKDLLGIPWRVAHALRADGWWLRCDVIWAKANLTPEPARDRPAHSHEHVFLLAPSHRYHYDGFAVREPGRDPRSGGWRNRRSVWTLPTAAFPGAHFATFPTALAEPCVLAGSSPVACGRCGAPWRRIVSSRRLLDGREVRGNWGDPTARLLSGRRMRRGERYSKVEVHRETVGWEPSCGHRDPSGRSVVLDPFAGSGTTGLVALRHGRDFLGVELSGAYAQLARRRLKDAGRRPAGAR